MIRNLIIAFVIVLQSNICLAQKFDPFNGKAADYHVNLRLFFPDSVFELSSRKALQDSIRVFNTQTTWTVQNLRARLNSYENLYSNMQRHYQYFRLSGERNRKDTAIKHALTETGDQLDALHNTIDSVLQLPVFVHLSAAQIKEQHLLPYSYLLAQEAAKAPHLLPPAEEKLSNALADQTSDRLTDRYDDMMDTIKAGPVTVAGKTYNVNTDKVSMLQSSDPDVRAAAMGQTFSAYSRHGELFAATLIDITQENNALAVAHKYHNAPEKYYGERIQLSEDTAKDIFQKVAANAQVLKDYQLLQQQIIHKTGYTGIVHSWDLGLISTYHWQPLSFTDISRLINNALTPLGENYQQHFAKLLDPQNGLLDIVYTPNRAGGGNSFGSIGTPIGLFMQSFDGSFRNTSTLIHEGGHAIHRQLMSDNHVNSSYSSGPNFMFEAYAMLNELLLLDELEKQAKTSDEKAYYTRLFVDKLAHEIFTSAEEGAFEQGLYDGVASGRIKGLKDINLLYSGIMKQYDLYFPNETAREIEWTTKSLVFEDPLYNVNYLFAMLVTCKLYQQHFTDKDFAHKYTALLSHGFDEPVKDLLKNYMDIDLNYPALLDNALTLMHSKTVLLSKLTAMGN